MQEKEWKRFGLSLIHSTRRISISETLATHPVILWTLVLFGRIEVWFSRFVRINADQTLQRHRTGSIYNLNLWKYEISNESERRTSKIKRILEQKNI